MPQFDFLIASSLFLSLTLSLIFYYVATLKVLIPSFFGTKKFRKKKLNLYTFYRFLSDSSEIKAFSSAGLAI
jgi:hypothetical protein